MNDNIFKDEMDLKINRVKRQSTNQSDPKTSSLKS